MTIEEFADTYRVRRLPRGKPSKRCNNLPIEAEYDVVEGKAGYIGLASTKSLPDQGFPSRKHLLQLNLMAVPRAANRDRLLTGRFKLAQAAGFELKGKAGAESRWYFNPEDKAQAEAAIKIVGAARKRTRVLTEDQKQVLRDRMAAVRKNAA